MTTKKTANTTKETKNKTAKIPNPPVQYNEQYFVKRGKAYYPANDPGAYAGLGEGSWLVVVDKGCTSIRTAVEPQFISLDAALKYLEDGLAEAISESSKVRPRTTIMTEKERRAWKEFRAIMGKDMPKYVEFPSHSEIAKAGCDFIRAIMLKHNCDPAKIKASNDYTPKKVRCTNPIFDLET